MVRHHAVHDLPAAARACARAVERLTKAVLPRQTARGESAQIAHRRTRRNGQREKGAVRREHELTVHVRLHGQRRAAVRLVAVAQGAVERKVRALRHAPRLTRAHAPPLYAQTEFRALPQQGITLRRQKQLRHQILEHRPRPRHAAAVALVLHLRARQGAPVLARHVAARHGKVRRQARLALEQVVIPLGALAAAGVDADVHQAALRVVEQGKVHAVAERLRPRRKLRLSPAAQGVCRREQGGGAVAAVHRGHIQRRHRPQRARVIPVVKVPVPARELLHGREHPLRQSQPAPVVNAQRVCAERGQERKAHVRRRCAVRCAGRRLGLHVVRRQVVLPGGAERLKILPRRLRPAQQLPLRRMLQRRCTGCVRRAEGREHERGERPHDAGRQPRRTRREHGREQTERTRRPERAQIRPQSVAFCRSLRRRLPLQEIPVRDRHAPERRHDGGDVQRRLPRQQDQPQHRLHHGGGESRQNAAVIAHARVRRVHDRMTERKDESLRQREQRGICRQPQPRPAQHAAEEDGCPRCRGDERAPQAVRQPEPVDRMQRPCAPGEDPRRVLPVAADPPVRPRAPCKRRGGEGVRELHVAEKAAVQVGALERVVAEDALLGQGIAAAAGEQRAHVEDALARKAAAVEAVHIQLPAHAAVGVAAAGTCEYACPVARACALQLRRHARVQQTVAVRDHAAPRVHDRAVERMEHRAHERTRSARRQARVGIEREQIRRAVQRRRVAGGTVDRVRLAAQKLREPEQRAALALPRAPFSVGRLHPWAREEVKPPAIARVERFDLRARRAQDRLVSRRVRLRRLRKICQQPEQELLARVAAAQRVFLQTRGERVRVAGAGEQRRDHAQGPALRRDAAPQRQPRHEARLRHAQQHRIEQSLDRFRHRDQQQHRARHAPCRKAQQQRQSQRPRRDRSDVPRAAAALFRGAEHLAQQKPAHVPPRALAALCAREHVLGNVGLRAARAPRKLCRCLPVVFARGCVHRGVDARRVARKDAPHMIAPLGERCPRGRAERAQRREERGRGSSAARIGVRQRADRRRLQPRHEQRKLPRLERQRVLKARKICLRGSGRERAAAGAQQPRAADVQHGLCAGCTQRVRMAQRSRGVVCRGAGKIPVVAQPRAVWCLGRDGARRACECARSAPEAAGVRAAAAGHGQRLGVAPPRLLQGGGVGFGHVDPSKNGLQYQNVARAEKKLCGDKKKCLTPARRRRILPML